MKLVCISDTHNKFDYKNLPEGDVLIHAGDLTMNGTLAEVAKELNLIRQTPYLHKVIIPGNHDFLFENDRGLASGLLKDSGITYLEDSGCEINGVKFYGMPWVPGLPRWAFSNRRVDWPGKLKQIPDDTDVLITHAPAWFVRDYVRPSESRDGIGINLGSKKLLARVNEINPKVHVCGHIHDSSGVIKLYKTIRVNAAICDESYQPTNPPRIIEI